MDIKVKPETSGMQELRELEILFGTYEPYRVSVNNATQYIKFLRVILRLGYYARHRIHERVQEGL